MNSNVVIKLDNITKSYKLYDRPVDRLKEALSIRGKKYHKDFYALNDVSFEIKKGDTVGIIGKNGSGKSTLLKIITGVLTQSSGNVNVVGKISALLELGAGFNPEYTGIENIYFQGSIMGYTRDDMKKRLEGIIEFADIGDFINQPVKMYSSGMFARLAFAVAINVDPDILIVDEALAVGDANFQLKCHKRMDELRNNGVTILFVSHDTYSVKALCNKALFLKNGVVQSYGNALDVVNDYLIYLDSEGKENKEDYIIKSEDSDEKSKDAEEYIDEVNYDQKDIASISSVGIFGKHILNNELTIHTGETFELLIDYKVFSKDLEKIVFVFNLYRERDQTYVCGTTTLMDGLKPIKTSVGKHTIKLKFIDFAPLSGRYRLRCAINEQKGIGIITENKEALYLIVKDSHEAEGVVNLKRIWTV